MSSAETRLNGIGLYSRQFGAHLRYFLIHLIVAYLFPKSLYTDNIWVLLTAVIGTVFLMKIRHHSYKSAMLSYTIFFTIFLWYSSYWNVFCINKFMELSLTMSYALLMLACVVASFALSLPVALYRWQDEKLRFGLSFALCFVVCEYLRMHTMLAMPWIFSGHIGTPISLLAKLYSVGGIFLVGYILLRCAEIVMNVLLIRYDADARFLLPILLTISLYLGYSEFFAPESHPETKAETINVRLIQGNHTEFSPEEFNLSWQYYVSSLLAAPENVLNITPESVLILNTDLSISKFRSYAFLKNSLVGVQQVRHDGDHPMIVGTNGAHGIYEKRHLVPFGEYLPVPKAWLQWIPHFQNNHSEKKAAHGEINLLDYKNFHFFPMICYDLFFPTWATKALAKTDAIVAIGENRWYRESIYQQLFLRAASIRALETKRPLLVVMNRGPSSYVLENGKIDKQLAAYERGVLEVTLPKNSHLTQPIYQYLNDLWIVGALILFEFLTRAYANWIHPNQRVKK